MEIPSRKKANSPPKVKCSCLQRCELVQGEDSEQGETRWAVDQPNEVRVGGRRALLVRRWARGWMPWCLAVLHRRCVDPSMGESRLGRKSGVRIKCFHPLVVPRSPSPRWGPVLVTTSLFQRAAVALSGLFPIPPSAAVSPSLMSGRSSRRLLYGHRAMGPKRYLPPTSVTWLIIRGHRDVVSSGLLFVRLSSPLSSPPATITADSKHATLHQDVQYIPSTLVIERPRLFARNPTRPLSQTKTDETAEFC